MFIDALPVGPEPVVPVAKTARVHSAALPPRPGQQPDTASWSHNPNERYFISADEAVAVKPGVRGARIEQGAPSKNFATMDDLEDASIVSHLRNAPAPLGHLSLKSRLELHTHGTSRTVFSQYPTDAAGLAEQLHYAGLKHVGTLSIEACDVGRKCYLDDLKNELSKRDIQAGYLSAPEGALLDILYPMTSGRSEFAFRIVPKVVSNMTGENAGLKFGNSGYKVIRGNADPRFYESAPRPKGRYVG